MIDQTWNLFRSAIEARLPILDVSLGVKDSMVYDGDGLHDEIMHNISAGFKMAHVFTMDEQFMEAVNMTNPPKDTRGVNLPFQCVYLDVSQLANIHNYEGDYWLNGILAIRMFVDPDNPVMSNVDMSTVEDKEYWVIVTLGIRQRGEENEKFFIVDNVHRFDIENPKPYKLPIVTDSMFNILLFLNHPEVEYILRERTEKTNLRRKRKGKLPLPTTRKVIVKGKLKRYMTKLSDTLTEYDPTHSWWVRGHLRWFRAKRYGDKVGTSTWIEPYIKGNRDKLLIEKTYEVRRE